MTSVQFYDKLLNVFDCRFVRRDYLHSSILWCIDSKYRKLTKLDRFLSDQLENTDDSLIKVAVSCIGKDDDATILNILQWVTKNIVYKSDVAQYNKDEYWADAIQVLTKKADDCDGMNGLIYILARLAGIVQYKLFCCIGEMRNGGGHFYVMYYSTKELKLVTIDATYYPDFSPVKQRLSINEMWDYLTPWYIFNEEICIKPI